MSASGDDEFMGREGIDILVETARMWADLGFWRDQPRRVPAFHIHGVTGPDEYTTVVNDNLFTNVMARFNLRQAAEVVQTSRRTCRALPAVVARLDLDAGRGRGVVGRAEAM